MRQILAISSLILLVSACGSASDDKAAPAQEVAAPTSEPLTTKSTSLYVTTAAELPVCSPEAQGHLVYVQAENAFRACLANEWKPVDVRGAVGKEGVAGKDGEPGKSEAVTSTFDCKSEDSANRYFMHYKLMTFTSGDQMIFASVQDLISRIGSGSSAVYGVYYGFNSRFIKAGESNAGAITVTWLDNINNVTPQADFEFDAAKSEVRAFISANPSQPYLLACTKE